MGEDTAEIPGVGEIRAEITGELREAMSQAATYEELLACWVTLKAYIDTVPKSDKQLGEVIESLDLACRCFQRSPYACDTGVKRVFEDKNALVRESLGIPREFLLQTVRVGAIKSMLCDVEKSPHESVSLPVDGTVARVTSDEIEEGRLEDSEKERKRLIRLLRQTLSSPNVDGLGWANKQFEGISAEKHAAVEAEKKAAAEQLKQSKEAALVNIQARMHEPNFHLEAKDAKLLQRDFQDKLRAWKGFFESRPGKLLSTFIQENRESELTPEFFAKFMAACTAESEIKEDYFDNAFQSLPVDILNPNSAWFSVLIINKIKTFGKFFTSTVSNMNGWFEL